MSLIRWEPFRALAAGTTCSPFAHGPIRDHLAWCRAEGVRSAVFSHCGPQIVAGDERRSEARVAELARAAGVEASLAYDGMTRVVAARRWRAVTG